MKSRGDVSVTSNVKSSLRDRSETDAIHHVSYGAQFSGPRGAGKKSLRIQKDIS